MLSISLVTANASADDTHYQNLLVGEHALGLGGAFTALADDSSAAFYNPAGLALISHSSISGSLSVYGFEFRQIDDAYRTPLGSADFEEDSTPTFPISVGLVRKFGAKQEDRVRNHALAFSTVIPFQSKVTFRGDVTDGEIFQHLRIIDEDRWIWVGPSYAYRFTPRLAVGVTAYYANRALTHLYDRSVTEQGRMEAGIQTLQYGNIDSREIELDDDALLIRVGVLWQPTDRFRVGLTVALPSIPIGSSGTVTRRQLLADFVVPGSEYGTFSDDSEERETKSPFPFHARLGTATLIGLRSRLTADLSVYAPVSYDRISDGGIPLDAYFVQHVDRLMTVNGNMGFETLLGSHVPLRVGAFTNFSSAPDPEAGDVAMMPRIHRFGATLSSGYRDEGYDIQVGLAGLWGRGHTLVPSAGLPLDPAFERAAVEETAVYLFISGAKEAAGRVVDRWLRH